jgi:hypothetical protein
VYLGSGTIFRKFGRILGPLKQMNQKPEMVEDLPQHSYMFQRLGDSFVLGLFALLYRSAVFVLRFRKL